MHSQLIVDLRVRLVETLQTPLEFILCCYMVVSFCISSWNLSRYEFQKQVFQMALYSSIPSGDLNLPEPATEEAGGHDATPSPRMSDGEVDLIYCCHLYACFG